MNARQQRQLAWFAEDRARVKAFNECDPKTLARANDPASSHRAAMSIVKSGVQKRQADAVFEALRRWDGSTTKELAELSGLDRHMIGRRMTTLERESPARVRRYACEGDDVRWFVVR